MSFARRFGGSELHEREHVGPTPAAHTRGERPGSRAGRISMKPAPSGSACHLMKFVRHKISFLVRSAVRT